MIGVREAGDVGGGGRVLQCSWEGWEGEGGGEGEAGEGRCHTQSALCVRRCDKGSGALSDSMGDVGREVWTCTEEPWTLSLEKEGSELSLFLHRSIFHFLPPPSSLYLSVSLFTVQRMHPCF